MRGFILKIVSALTQLQTRNMVMLQSDHMLFYETSNWRQRSK